MTITHTTPHPKRSVTNAMAAGLRCKCPNCGEADIFEGFTAVKHTCENCSQELHHQRADDLPIYLNVFIVGHIVVALLMVSMQFEIFGMWTTAIGGSILAVIMAILLMRPLKGMVVGLQWALGMHGFDKSL
jgi:uncharacterized protein (DUF983 family)